MPARPPRRAYRAVSFRVPSGPAWALVVWVVGVVVGSVVVWAVGSVGVCAVGVWSVVVWAVGVVVGSVVVWAVSRVWWPVVSIDIALHSCAVWGGLGEAGCEASGVRPAHSKDHSCSSGQSWMARYSPLAKARSRGIRRTSLP